MNRLEEVEKIFNLKFPDKALLTRALTHTSYANEHDVLDYERLEFLGDAVIELCASNYLYNNFNYSEGIMTSKRAEYVRKEALATYARNICLDKYVLLGTGIEKDGGRDNDSILSDAFEAVFATIYLAYGFNQAYQKFLELVVPHLADVEFRDYKGMFQELVQAEKRSVIYKTISETGPSNNRTFEVNVYIDDILYGVGIGKSRKAAEQMAAKAALDKKALHD